MGLCYSCDDHVDHHHDRHHYDKHYTHYTANHGVNHCHTYKTCENSRYIDTQCYNSNNANNSNVVYKGYNNPYSSGYYQGSPVYQYSPASQIPPAYQTTKPSAPPNN